jgi:hypothetical protein
MVNSHTIRCTYSLRFMLLANSMSAKGINCAYSQPTPAPTAGVMCPTAGWGNSFDAPRPTTNWGKKRILMACF